ncbi:unnamed protein product, partial [Polarella glacialis]
VAPTSASGQAQDYGKAALTAYETAVATVGGPSGDRGASRSLAFTTSWLLVVPLAPPDVSSPRHEAWLNFPPPPPCALCGVVICPPVEKSFPETAAGAPIQDGQLVSSRAVQEGIPGGSDEYEIAIREVRISSQILEKLRARLLLLLLLLMLLLSVLSHVDHDNSHAISTNIVNNDISHKNTSHHQKYLEQRPALTTTRANSISNNHQRQPSSTTTIINNFHHDDNNNNKLASALPRDSNSQTTHISPPRPLAIIGEWVLP